MTMKKECHYLTYGWYMAFNFYKIIDFYYLKKKKKWLSFCSCLQSDKAWIWKIIISVFVLKVDYVDTKFLQS